MITRQQWLQLKADIEYLEELRDKLHAMRTKHSTDALDGYFERQQIVGQIEASEHSLCLELARLLPALEPQEFVP